MGAQVQYSSKSTKLIMSISPRCGNTVIEKFMEPLGDTIRDNGNAKRTASLIEKKDYLSIMMMRNPYDRVVSSYFWAAKHANEYKNKNISFRYFLESLKGKDLNLPKVNFHWACQSRKEKFDYIFRTEDQWDKVVQIIKDKRNIVLDIPERQRVWKKRTCSDIVCDLPYSEIRVNGTTPDYKFYYDDEGIIRNMVTKLYKEDINLYQSL
jgi:hypothetical protein